MAKDSAQLMSVPNPQQPTQSQQLSLQEEFWASIAEVAQDRPAFTVVYDLRRFFLILGTVKCALSMGNFPEMSRRDMINLIDDLIRQFEPYPNIYLTLKSEWARFVNRTTAPR